MKIRFAWNDSILSFRIVIYENKKSQISRDRPCYFFCWLATSSNGHFFQYFLCFWCLTRFAENGSQVKWNKKGLGNFDGLEQKPKESNVTLITSYPSKETLFVKLLLLFTFSKLTYRFSLFNYKPKFKISQNGWCGLFLRFLTLTSSQNIIIRQALKSWGIGDYNLSSLSKLGGSNSSLTTRFLLPRRRQFSKCLKECHAVDKLIHDHMSSSS